MTTKILFLGDIFAKPGRLAVQQYLPHLKEDHGIDFVVANAENMAGGWGVTHETLQEIYAAGVNAVTLGNHTWRQKKDIDNILEMDRKVIRPANFTNDTGGKGFRVYKTDNGKRIGVLSLFGHVNMFNKASCPFEYSRSFIKEHRMGDDYDVLMVDFHAEATSEKECLGHVWDGKASLFVGTHTHVPTADTRIQPKGTGYQTDAGMCGYYDSAIGSTFESALKRFETSRGGALQPATGEPTLCGVYAEIDDNGMCSKIQSIRLGGVLQQQGITSCLNK